MKICIVSAKDKQKFGGGSFSTNTLANTLEKGGHDVTFAESPNEINNPDIVLHTNIKYLVQTQRICEKKNLPLVITPNSFISCCNGTHVTNKDPKYGVSCEKCSLLGMVDCFVRDRRNAQPSLKTRIFNCITPLPRYVLRYMRMNALNKADKVVCISPTERKMLRMAGVEDEKMIVIPQPVDFSFLEKPDVQLSDEKVCLFAGGISWIKGAHLATEAVSKLDDVKLVFVGKVRTLKPYIEKTLGDRAMFVGVIPADEMKNYYHSAHVVLFPSIWFEAFGRVWAEACMCGKPVVAFNGRGGASDFLEHEKTGLLSDYDVDAYAEQIQRLFDDDTLYKRVSKNAQEYAKKNFLADVVANKYEKVFEAVLNER